VVADELWLADDDRFLVADYEACKMPRAAMNLQGSWNTSGEEVWQKCCELRKNCRMKGLK
jgi:hypothetical protein